MKLGKSLSFIIPLLFSLPEVSSSTKWAGEFLELGVGARAQGMGSAFVALSGDATSPYWNPAGCARLACGELFLMHSERFAGMVKHDCLAYGYPSAQPSGRRGYGALLTRVGVDEIKVTALEDSTDTSTVYVERMVNAADYCLELAYGQARGSLSAGASLKLLRRSTGTNTAFGAGFDLGILFSPKEGVSLGANLKDLTTTVLVWNTGKREYVVPSLRSGLALSTETGFLPGRLNLALDVEVRFENRGSASQLSATVASADLHLGGEWWYKDVVALRVGSDLGNLTMGCGLFYKNYRFDYALLSNEDLGGTHKISGSLMLK